MIVKLAVGISRRFPQTIRHIILRTEGKWIKCAPPFQYNTLNVIIDGHDYRILSSSITNTINDERVNYVQCSYCGTTQLKCREECESCNRDKTYLKPLIDSDCLGFDEVIKDSLFTVFGI